MTFAYLIPLFPLAAFLVILFGGKRLGHKSAWVAVAGSASAAILSTWVIVQVIRGATFHHEFTWLVLGQTRFTFGLLVDPLTAMMLFVVTYVGTMIFIYSIGYMHEDPRFSRFFAYLSLFMFSMLGLTIANHYLQLYIFWELVGLCSYLLISFWFEKESAANAGRKAFITTRVGDIGLFIGLMLLFYATGTLQFRDFTHEFVASKGHEAGWILTLSCVLIFAGACGKSAQFPLHVWLPDAMEGPTPVSALIHAATMVAAGVYLIARSFPIFSHFPDAMTVVAVIGTITACMAAFIALTANDIKKVLAYSTISQLGYMMAALGLGGFSAGTFHLMTHAFFKALLFLGAGSVIHGTHSQDIREMGGLFGKMKVTAVTFLVASLAISGVPPLSGFFSKDEILLAAYESGQPVFFYALLVTAFLTAFYMFRLYALTFFGKPRTHLHAHESPAVMTVPLSVLAVFSALIGIPGSPWMHHWFQTFIHGGHAEEIHAVPFVVQCSIGAGLGGIMLALLLYLVFPKVPGFIAAVFKPLYLVSSNKFWMDELYQAAILKPAWALGRLLFRFDQTVVDGVVNQAAVQTVNLSGVKRWIDEKIVDGAVNATGAVTQWASGILRKIQTGLIQNYLLLLVLGFLLAIIVQIL
ncbi:MAG: NADH-quinone oxidoreductase subunit L [Candidatus Omnitrophica bacterium]|nr:NADH-quinone oxidoreductase subunit L [Candidatus Omnitrophota bacterium]